MKILVCKKEAIGKQGQKLLQFTKGKEYEFYEGEDGLWNTIGDNGVSEQFWNIDIMFEPKKD